MHILIEKLKFVIFTLLVMLLTGGLNLVCAENPSNTPVVVVVAKKMTPSNSQRPKSPSNAAISISIFVQSGIFELDLNDVESEYVSVDIENLDTGDAYSDIVYASDPYINMSLTSAYYSITCTTDDGSMYTGVFEIS